MIENKKYKNIHYTVQYINKKYAAIPQNMHVLQIIYADKKEECVVKMKKQIDNYTSVKLAYNFNLKNKSKNKKIDALLNEKIITSMGKKTNKSGAIFLYWLIHMEDKDFITELFNDNKIIHTKSGKSLRLQDNFGHTKCFVCQTSSLLNKNSFKFTNTDHIHRYDFNDNYLFVEFYAKKTDISGKVFHFEYQNKNTQMVNGIIEVKKIYPDSGLYSLSIIKDSGGIIRPFLKYCVGAKNFEWTKNYLHKLNFGLDKNVYPHYYLSLFFEMVMDKKLDKENMCMVVKSSPFFKLILNSWSLTDNYTDRYLELTQNYSDQEIQQLIDGELGTTDDMRMKILKRIMNNRIQKQFKAPELHEIQKCFWKLLYKKDNHLLALLIHLLHDPTLTYETIFDIMFPDYDAYNKGVSDLNLEKLNKHEFETIQNKTQKISNQLKKIKKFNTDLKLTPKKIVTSKINPKDHKKSIILKCETISGL